MSGARVLWLRLSERTSAKGTAYLSGWCGQARVVGVRAKDADKFGNPQWELFIEPPRDRPPAHQAERGVATGQAVQERADRWQAQADQSDDPF